MEEMGFPDTVLAKYAPQIPEPTKKLTSKQIKKGDAVYIKSPQGEKQVIIKKVFRDTDGIRKIQTTEDKVIGISAIVRKVGEVKSLGAAVPEYTPALREKVVDWIRELATKARAKWDKILDAPEEFREPLFQYSGELDMGKENAYQMSESLAKKLVENRLGRQSENTVERVIKDRQYLKERTPIMTIYWQTKNNPQWLQKYYNAVPKEIQRYIDKVGTLTPVEKGVAEEVGKYYADMLKTLREAVGPGEVGEIQQYVNQIWRRAKGGELLQSRTPTLPTPGEPGKKITKERLFREGYLEGIAYGHDPFTLNLLDLVRIYGESATRLMAGRNYLNKLKILVDADGQPLVTENLWQPRYRLLELLGKRYAVNPDIAWYLENEFKPSPMSESKILQANAVLKTFKLITSFFHYSALFRESIGAGVNPFTGWYEGLNKLHEKNPQVMDLMNIGGLTWGGNQDFGPELMKKALSSQRLPIRVIRGFTELWNKGLWDHYHKGIKVMGALNALRYNQKAYPDMSYEGLLRKSAGQANNFFGGLNYRRLARSKILQDVFRAIALAPDWTESNFRSMADAFTPTGGFTRQYWGKQAIFWMTTLQISNLMLTRHTTDENDEGHKLDLELPWKDEKGRKIYVNIMGHIKDPIRMISEPTKFAFGKRSVMWRIVDEQLRGTDWRGRPFATLEDIKRGKWYGSPKETGFWKTLPGRGILLGESLAPIPVEAAAGLITGEKTLPQVIGSMTGFGVSRSRKKTGAALATGGFGRRGF